MIEETISRIEERLRAAQALSPEQRAELQELLSELRKEARSLPVDALPAQPGTVSGLQEALTQFETSHPQLTSLVNRLSTMLSNMGI